MTALVHNVTTVTESSCYVACDSQALSCCRYVTCVWFHSNNNPVFEKLQIYSNISADGLRGVLGKGGPFKIYTCIYRGVRGSVVVKALCYKPKGRGFES
jgi:hypothetical protein